MKITVPIGYTIHESVLNQRRWSIDSDIAISTLGGIINSGASVN